MREPERARALLAHVAGALPGQVVLWRGTDLRGSDVDLLVLDESSDELERIFSDLGLRRALGDPRHVVWKSAVKGGFEFDVLVASAWPRYYPRLSGVLSRVSEAGELPDVTSAEDRLLIFAAEAVAGRSLSKICARARQLLTEPGTRERLGSVGLSEGMSEFATLIADPDLLAQRTRRGRLPYRYAVAAAVRSKPARLALQARVQARITRFGSGRNAPAHGLVISFSGMDGSGKSAAATTARDTIQSEGGRARIAWARFGDSQGVALDRIGRPIKLALRRQGRIANPVATGGAAADGPDAPPASRRAGAVAWLWTIVVASVAARQHRRAARASREGVTIVCDRWLADDLVDLELRYGRHAVAELILRRFVPRADLGILLEVDAPTARARKPDDQAKSILEAMEQLYARWAVGLNLERVDANAPADEVQASVVELVTRLVHQRSSRQAVDAAS